MTGEITLRGRVLPVGGVKEKVLAAHRAGLKTIVLPKKNDKDLVDVPKNAKRDLKFVFVEHMDEVLTVALRPAEAASVGKSKPNGRSSSSRAKPRSRPARKSRSDSAPAVAG